MKFESTIKSVVPREELGLFLSFLALAAAYGENANLTVSQIAAVFRECSEGKVVQHNELGNFLLSQKIPFNPSKNGKVFFHLTPLSVGEPLERWQGVLEMFDGEKSPKVAVVERMVNFSDVSRSIEVAKWIQFSISMVKPLFILGGKVFVSESAIAKVISICGFCPNISPALVGQALRDMGVTAKFLEGVVMFDLNTLKPKIISR